MTPVARARWRALGAAALVASGSPSCGNPRLVAPLRYETLEALADQAFRARPPKAALEDAEPALTWRQTALPNGVRIAHVERHTLPIVSIAVVIDRAGQDVSAPPAAYELLVAMLNDGTAMRSKPELAAAYARLGASPRVFATADGYGLSITVRSEDVDAAIALMTEAVIHPRLTATDFQNSAARWFQDFANSELDDSVLLVRNARALVFSRTHPYGYRKPQKAHVAVLGVEQIAALHARLVQPAHVTLVVAGDVGPTVVDATAARFLGSLVPNAPVARAPVSLARAAEPHGAFVETRDETHLEVVVAVEGPPAASADVAVVQVLGQALGGLTSPLRAEVNEHTGAAYVFGLFGQFQRMASIVGIACKLDTRKAIGGLQTMLAAVRSARASPMSEAELEIARTMLIAQWAERASRTSGIVSMATEAILNGMPLEILSAYPARVRAVTAADVQRAAQTYFSDSALRIVATGDARSFYELWRGFGYFEPRTGFAEPAPMPR